MRRTESPCTVCVVLPVSLLTSSLVQDITLSVTVKCHPQQVSSTDNACQAQPEQEQTAWDQSSDAQGQCPQPTQWPNTSRRSHEARKVASGTLRIKSSVRLFAFLYLVQDSQLRLLVILLVSASPALDHRHTLPLVLVAGSAHLGVRPVGLSYWRSNPSLCTCLGSH